MPPRTSSAAPASGGAGSVGMIASSQPARVTIGEPAAARLPAAAPAAASATTKTDETPPAPAPGTQDSDAGGARSAAVDDPVDHPLVKGVMERFAAKIVEVRRKE